MKRFLTSTVILCALGAHGQWLTDSLIAHFPMDGSPNDTVGGLVPLVTSGSPTFCADRFGNPDGAACFDGASFWSYGDELDVEASDFTISFWYRSESEDAARLVTKGNTVFGTPGNAGYSFGFGDDGGSGYVGSIYVFDDQANESVTAVPVVVSQWAHMVATRCDTILSVHLNGPLYSQVPTIRDGNLNSNIVFAIGALDRNPTPEPDGSFFLGAVDDLRLYKGRCLTQAEISALADLTVEVTEIGATGQALHLSPNPATQTLRIDLTGSENITGPVLVLNALGQPVPIIPGYLARTSVAVRSLTVDAAGLPNGAYFVVVPTEKGRAHGRFVKE